MKVKKAYLLFTAGMSALLCLSAYIVIRTDNSEINVSVCVDYIDTESTSFCISSQYTEITNVTSTKKEIVTNIYTETTSEYVEEELYIDINTASAEELQKLNGIGEVLSAAIIEYREKNGGFKNKSEIINVNGIGNSIYNGICDKIYVIIDETEEVQTEFEADTATEELITSEVFLKLEDIAPINLNYAGIQELILLPYVDEEIAEKIIELREAIVFFSHPYELLYIDGLGQNQVAEIVNFVTVEQ